MKWCIQFPEEEMLIKRPSLKRACCGNDAAASLLSYFLYRASISPEYKHDQRNPVRSIPIGKTQQQILEEMGHEICERTLRSTAIPLLVALGYLRVKSQEKHLLDLDVIQDGIDHGRERAVVLPRLRTLATDGTIAAQQRQYYRRLVAMLPEEHGKTTESSGIVAATKTRTRAAPQAASPPLSLSSKNQEKNQDERRGEEEREGPLRPASPSLEEKARSMGQPASSPNETRFPEARARTTLSSPPQKTPALLNETRGTPSSHEQDSKLFEQEAQGTTLTAEGIVASWEAIRGSSYHERGEYTTQLRAARILLTLPFPQPLSGELLEQVYTAFFDTFWQTTYGELHLSHLVERERSSGRIRVMRWIERLLRQKQADHSSMADLSRMQGRGHMVTPSYDERPGEQGGWERFAKGTHPDDDLEAAVRRLQAEGKLPIFEDGQVGHYA